ncbi:inositol polyphosphate multikinase [Culicoides brevitarsis]|uniref:inositol polyphosphate multikinase n=1 Tax=Culicoides brevitarsis TaxID=469753 RepID=UPI00307B7731
MSIPVLPKGTILLENQVAGHTFQDSAQAIGMLKSSNEGFIFKPLTKPDCAVREKAFYEQLEVAEDQTSKELRQMVPKFHGVHVMSVRGRDVQFVKLTDITSGMTEPCVIDIKIGKRTWDPTASEAKRMVESSKYVRCKENVGFCIPGFQVFSISAGKVKRYGKEYGKSLDENSVLEAFKLFLNADTKLYRPLIQKILQNLRQIQSWAVRQRKFLLYSSSVLIAYDAKRLKEFICKHDEFLQKLKSDEMLSLNEDSQPDWVQVKMIDFAHQFPNEERTEDTNYTHGIGHLVQIFEDILQHC